MTGNTTDQPAANRSRIMQAAHPETAIPTPVSAKPSHTDQPTVRYDGHLAGLERVGGDWCFEGRTYDTPADETAVLETSVEALSEPEPEQVAAAHTYVFRGPNQFTAQALLAMAVAYEQECTDGDACDPVVAILREAARRVAVVEALTV